MDSTMPSRTRWSSSPTAMSATSRSVPGRGAGCGAAQHVQLWWLMATTINATCIQGDPPPPPKRRVPLRMLFVTLRLLTFPYAPGCSRPRVVQKEEKASRAFRTVHARQTRHPEWNMSGRLWAADAGPLRFTVYDKHLMKKNAGPFSHRVCVCVLGAGALLLLAWYSLGEPCGPAATRIYLAAFPALSLTLAFSPSAWLGGVGAAV